MYLPLYANPGATVIACEEHDKYGGSVGLEILYTRKLKESTHRLDYPNKKKEFSKMATTTTTPDSGDDDDLERSSNVTRVLPIDQNNQAQTLEEEIPRKASSSIQAKSMDARWLERTTNHPSSSTQFS